MNLAMILDIPASIVPDGVAVIGPEDRATYDDLRARAIARAAHLAALGVRPGDRVGIFATNSVAYVEALFGIAWLGAVAVPMNFRAAKEEAAHLLADSGAVVAYTEDRYRPLLEEVRPTSLRHVVLLADRSADEVDEGDMAAEVEDEDVAALLYTSGTTALPKGVMLSHGALTGYVMETEAADGTDQGRMLVAAPLYHVAAVTSLLMAVWAGRTPVLLAQFEAGAWLDAVDQHRVTHAFLVPTMLARILDHPRFDSHDLSSLELVTYGAAPMPPAVIARAVSRFPPTCSFSGAYGQTETTATVTVLDADDHRLEGTPAEVEVKRRRLSSVGRPLDDVELRVVGDDGKVLGAGQVGEVELRTPRSMRGYWGSDEKTRVTVDDQGWVHTGDLGWLDDDGYLFLTGRASDLIIRGGENIAPEEVEAVLYEHPDVEEAAAVGVADEEWGERVMAAVVARPGAAVTEADLLAFLAPRLPGSKRPERVVLMAELPRTSTGKIIRRDLRPVVESLIRG